MLWAQQHGTHFLPRRWAMCLCKGLQSQVNMLVWLLMHQVECATCCWNVMRLCAAGGAAFVPGRLLLSVASLSKGQHSSQQRH